MKVLKTIFVLLLIFITPAIAEGTLELPSSLQTIKAEAFADTSAFTEIVVPYGTNSIESRAFANSNLKLIHLPASISSIADDAFEGCTNLTAIVANNSYLQKWCSDHGINYASKIIPASSFSYTIKDGEVCITDCKVRAAELTIPHFIDGYPVTSIGDNAFRDDDYITTVFCPPFLKSIGSSAFNGCSALSRVVLNEGLTTINRSAFYYCPRLKQIDFPESIAYIGASAFNDCGLTSVTVPRSITKLESGVFADCPLVSVQLPDTLTVIGAGAFGDCRNLTRITLPSSLTTIEEQAFHWCNSLQEVTLLSGVEIIQDEVFFMCTALESINLPATITSIGESVFDSCKNLTATVQEHTYANTWCQENNIPVNIIPNDYQFEIIDDCVTITAYTGMDAALTVPKLLSGLPVTKIAGSVFKNNLTLKSLRLPVTLVSIGDEAFSGCANLAELTIPDGISEIGSDAFKDCPNIGTVYATAGTNGATLISNLGFSFTDKRDKTLVFSQSADASGELSLEIRKYSGNAEELDIPEAFHDTKITAIGSSAFSGNATLMKVNLSEGLLSIGELAFAETPLKDINLPASLISVANNAFENCGNLLIFARDGSYGGKWCASSGIDYYLDTTPNAGSDFTVKNLSSTACAITGYTGERKVIAIPEKIDGRKVTTIGLDAFEKNTYITEVIIPSSVTTIEDYAFYRCFNLTKVSLSEGLKTIMSFAFSGCRFTEIDIPDSVTSIEGGAFSECDYLERIKLPKGLKRITAELFYSCDALDSITLPSTVTTIEMCAFQGAGIDEITIPGSVKTIGGMAFWNSHLSKVHISASVTSIGEEAFLKRVTFYCPKDSYAAKWAAENGNKIVYE